MHPLIRLQETNFTANLWGGTWIPLLKGLKPMAGSPVGESWEFSTHDKHPSMMISDSATSTSLKKWIETDPQGILGIEVEKGKISQKLFLVKFIDAMDDLSVQVHPPHEYALARENDSGKSESWIILDVGKRKGEGYIYLGFNPEKAATYSSPEKFKEAFQLAIEEANAFGPTDDPLLREKAGRLVLPFLNKIHVQPGEAYEINPGTIHAIGRGVRLYEIQQTSDLTYRVWDWNRADTDRRGPGKKEFRPLHLNKAFDVLDFKPRSPTELRQKPQPVLCVGQGTASENILVNQREGLFVTHEIQLGGTSEIEGKLNGRFIVLTLIQGEAEIFSRESAQHDYQLGIRLTQGNSIFVPASVWGYKICTTSLPATIFKSTIP